MICFEFLSLTQSYPVHLCFMVNKFPFTDQFFGQDKERIYDTFDYKAKKYLRC